MKTKNTNIKHYIKLIATRLMNKGRISPHNVNIELLLALFHWILTKGQTER